MTTLVLYDDEIARGFEPFALTRPCSELRAGTEVIRRRWELALAAEAAGFVGAAHLVDFDELDAPSAVRRDLAAGTIIAHSRCAPALRRVEEDADVWRCGGRVAAVRLTDPVDAITLAPGTMTLDTLASGRGRESEIQGWWMDEVWDLVRHLGPMVTADIEARVPPLDMRPARDLGAAVVGTHAACVEHGASIEPYVVFDTTAGPILVRRGASVAAFTRLVGPCYVGEETQISGGRIAASAIGEHSRVHGEVSMTVFLGHANKSHDGFVGHSYIGRWANLGAGTVTSNLKNTYGPVTLWTPRGVRDTGMQFLGTLFGDHVRTAIGTRLTTGSVIGAGANVLGAGMTAKVVAPFAWGAEPAAETYDADKFVEVAGRVMSRRNVTLSERARRWLLAAHSARWQVE